MLVLSRRIGEELRIGEAKIKVLGIKGTQVRLGIDAPKNMRVFRTELLEAMLANGETEMTPGYKNK